MAARKPMNLRLKKGALRKATGTSASGDMPEKDKQIKKGDSPLMRKRKQFALNAKKWHHGGKSATKKK
jgi:hypothetical protein